MSLIVSKRYSKALLEAFADAGKTEELAIESQNLIDIINQSDLMTFLKNDSYSIDDRKKVIQSLADNSSRQMSNFLNLLIRNKRVSLLEDILQETLLRIEDELGTAKVEVISAVALTDKQFEKVKDLSAKKFNLNDVEIINTIDSSIMGGMILKSRGKIIDSSIKTQLQKLTQEIM